MMEHTKIFKNKLFLIFITVLTAGIFGGQTVNADSNSLAQAFFQETNRLREQNNVPAVTSDKSLTDYAQQRAEVIAKNGALSHSGWHMINGMVMASENIGYQPNMNVDDKALAQELVKDFYIDYGNPDLGHRRSMLNPLYTELGVGIVKTGDTVYFVQEFGTTNNSFAKLKNNMGLSKINEINNLYSSTNWMKSVKTYYDLVEGAGIDSTPYTPIDMVATIGNNYRAQVYSYSPETLKMTAVPGKKLDNEMTWYTDKSMDVEGKQYIRVATNEWLLFDNNISLRYR